MKNVKGELVIGVGLLVLLFIIFNPWNVFMPGFVVMGLLIGIVVLFGIFAIFLWNESRGDEREEFHRLFADRIAYLAGSAAFIIAIVIQELAHALDPWLIAGLSVMILTKVTALIYGKIKL